MLEGQGKWSVSKGRGVRSWGLGSAWWSPRVARADWFPEIRGLFRIVFPIPYRAVEEKMIVHGVGFVGLNVSA